jgi:predicted RNase H-like HicB family nuclease
LPACDSQGATLDELLKTMKEAILLCLAELEEFIVN